MERARQGLEQGRAAMVVAVLLVALTWFLWMASPQIGDGLTPMGEPAAARIQVDAVVVPPALAVLGQVVGLAWMRRLHRAHREPEPRAWRYRDVD